MSLVWNEFENSTLRSGVLPAVFLRGRSQPFGVSATPLQRSDRGCGRSPSSSVIAGGSALDCFRTSSSSILLRLVLRTQPRSVPPAARSGQVRGKIHYQPGGTAFALRFRYSQGIISSNQDMLIFRLKRCRLWPKWLRKCGPEPRSQ